MWLGDLRGCTDCISSFRIGPRLSPRSLRTETKANNLFKVGSGTRRRWGRYIKNFVRGARFSKADFERQLSGHVARSRDSRWAKKTLDCRPQNLTQNRSRKMDRRYKKAHKKLTLTDNLDKKNERRLSSRGYVCAAGATSVQMARNSSKEIFCVSKPAVLLLLLFIADILFKEASRIDMKLWYKQKICRQPKMSFTSHLLRAIAAKLPWSNLWFIVDLFTGLNKHKFLEDQSLVNGGYPCTDFACTPVDVLLKFVSGLGWFEWGVWPAGDSTKG